MKTLWREDWLLSLKTILIAFHRAFQEDVHHPVQAFRGEAAHCFQGLFFGNGVVDVHEVAVNFLHNDGQLKEDKVDQKDGDLSPASSLTIHSSWSPGGPS